MVPRIKEAKYLGNYSIWLRFADGAEGEVDLSSELEGEVFEPLRNQDFFKTFVLHSELKTIVWPNGADFAPEFLRSSIRVAA
jgi:hypothetical protein